MSVKDDPTQGVFTVPLKNLQEGDSGMYMCLLDQNRQFKPPELVYNIRVTSDTPGLLVKDNTVEAELGGSVTVP
ncbi:polymeric immunoglobulin receptor-like, partial [Arapaima gigas]